MINSLAHRTEWPPWLKIEHGGKMHILAYNSKTKAFRANLTWGKIVYQVKIYLPSNFQMNRTTCCWVLCPKIGNFKEILQFLVIILNTNVDRDKL